VGDHTPLSALFRTVPSPARGSAAQLAALFEQADAAAPELSTMAPHATQLTVRSTIPGHSYLIVRDRDRAESNEFLVRFWRAFGPEGVSGCPVEELLSSFP